MNQWTAACLISLTLTLGCADSREITRRTSCPDFNTAVQPVLNHACLECHGPNQEEGNYRVDTQAAAFSRAQNGQPRIVAGDRSSLLLIKAGGGDDHPVAPAADLAVLQQWVVDCELSSLSNDLVHPRGWFNAGSANFHGKQIRDAGWDFGLCTECHGEPDDRSGGPAGKSCFACHVEGPTGCDTCHGTLLSFAPPPALDNSVATTRRGVGAHRIHLGGGPSLEKPIACEECHVVPTHWQDVGHIFDAAGNVDPSPTEVVFGAAANQSLEGLEFLRFGPPAYDSVNGSCQNVYCHGGALGDTGNEDPKWTGGGEEQARCDGCHKTPPSATHASGLTLADCANCHGLVVDSRVVDETLGFVSPELHLDGRLSLGDGSETCSACHGGADNAAPPTSVSGETSSDEPAVGAHQSHIRGGAFTGPMDCSVCHVIPDGTHFLEAVMAPGHIDTVGPAEVFPGRRSSWILAGADNATPTYEPTANTCTTVYCHGGGAANESDSAAGIIRTLDWTDVGNNTVVCGGCHGLPPNTPSHLQSMGTTPITVENCYLCHSPSIDDTGAIQFRPDGSAWHIDGEVTP